MKERERECVCVCVYTHVNVFVHIIMYSDQLIVASAPCKRLRLTANRTVLVCFLYSIHNKLTISFCN